MPAGSARSEAHVAAPTSPKPPLAAGTDDEDAGMMAFNEVFYEQNVGVS